MLGVTAMVHSVHHDDAVLVAKQTIDEMMSDETTTSRNKHYHDGISAEESA